jgi:hypothetical protein
MITGESIQQSCDLYFGIQEDFDYNPVIRPERKKQKSMVSWKEILDNPTRLFCYTHRIGWFAEKLHLLQHDFILFTHNSDENIVESPVSRAILDHPKCIEWHSQNILIDHPKLRFLPIGIANAQWKHGIRTFEKVIPRPKTKDIYFQFNIETNRAKRFPCYLNLQEHLEWLPTVEPYDHFMRLSEYKYCICPEGNGVDTHRLWECFYLKVIPIVKESAFTTLLVKQNLPLIVVKEWDYRELFHLKTNAT